MKLIVKTDDFTIVYLSERIRSMLWPAYYLKLANGYWYNMVLNHGMMLRIKHIGPVRKLNELLEVLNE